MKRPGKNFYEFAAWVGRKRYIFYFLKELYWKRVYVFGFHGMESTLAGCSLWSAMGGGGLEKTGTMI
jgi:hypothetical protein